MPSFLTTTIYRIRYAATGNKVSDFAAISAATAADIDATLGTNIFTSGDLKISAAATPPTGWLLCDGNPFDPTAYPGLNTAIGTAYGIDSGTGHPKVPDFRGRVIVGAGAGAGLTARSRGQYGGEETHQLTVAELAAHAHTIGPTPGPPGTFGATVFVYGQSGVVAESGGGAFAGGDQAEFTNNAGSDTPHNTMQPYGVASVFIKT